MNCAPTCMSIYIPSMWNHVSRDYVKHVFYKLDIGTVSEVEFINNHHNNSSQKSAFIHMQQFYSNTAAQNLAQRIMDPSKKARIVYDDPHYWSLNVMKIPERSLFLAHVKNKLLDNRLKSLEDAMTYYMVNTQHHSTSNLISPSPVSAAHPPLSPHASSNTLKRYLSSDKLYSIEQKQSRLL